MTRIIFQFPNEDAAESFLAWFSDGGGEYQFLDGDRYSFEDSDRKPIVRFDFSQAFPALGYDPKTHKDRTVTAIEGEPYQD